MSVSFEVYRIDRDGQRELVTTTQSAREAREVRDANPGEMLVVGRDDADQHLRNQVNAIETQEEDDDVEGDYLI